MNQPWLAEREVTAIQAKKLITDEFPDFKIETISQLGEGWDNIAFLVNNHYVFRFPRRTIAVGLLENEIKLLPLIQKHVQLRIPAPKFVGAPTDAFPWPFAGYKFLSGTTAEVATLSDQQRINNIESLAKFLKQLHTIPLENFDNQWEAHDELQRLNLATRVPQSLVRLEKLIKHFGFKELSPLYEYVETLSLNQPGYIPCLVHGDLYAKHMVLDDESQLTGIIDWGDAHFGNKAVDLAIAHTFIPVSYQKIFLETYGPVDTATWELAFFRAIYSTATILVYALDVGDVPLIAEAKYSFSTLLQGPLLIERDIETNR